MIESLRSLKSLGSVRSFGSPGGAVGNPIPRLWKTLRGLPGGKRLFSALVGRAAPYTGTIGAVVEELGPGYARLRLRDRKAVRNHLDSIHAVALMNLAEMTTGLAVVFGLPDDARGIVTKLSIEFLKKARGTLTAECRTDLAAASSEKHERQVEAVICDARGDIVAVGRAQWLIGPRGAE